jgi:hypothetical protein
MFEREVAAHCLTASQHGYQQEIWEVLKAFRFSEDEQEYLLVSWNSRNAVAETSSGDECVLLLRYLVQYLVNFIVLGSMSIHMEQERGDSKEVALISNAWAVALLKEICEDSVQFEMDMRTKGHFMWLKEIFLVLLDTTLRERFPFLPQHHYSEAGRTAQGVFYSQKVDQHGTTSQLPLGQLLPS